MNDSIVIIPTYNEKENIEAILLAVFSLSQPFDILIVDDGSPDGTADIVKNLQKTYNDKLYILERSGKQGLGTAYIAGFQYAIAKGYKYILEMDADFSHDPKDLISLRKSCEYGNHVAIGSRYATGVNVVNWPMGRVLLSYFASWYVRIITSMPIMDTTAGFVCYRRKVLETIPLDQVKFVGYAFQIEMKFLAWKYGFTLKEVQSFLPNAHEVCLRCQPVYSKEAFGVLQMTVQSWFKKYIPASTH